MARSHVLHRFLQSQDNPTIHDRVRGRGRAAPWLAQVATPTPTKGRCTSGRSTRSTSRRYPTDRMWRSGGWACVPRGGHCRRHANAANGMAIGTGGGLVVCEQGGRSDRRGSSVDRATGESSALADGWRGEPPLNSPNDVAVRRDGSIWFTDPSYGFLQGFRPRPPAGDYVYRHDPAGGTTGRRRLLPQAERPRVLARRANLYADRQRRQPGARLLLRRHACITSSRSP